MNKNKKTIIERVIITGTLAISLTACGGGGGGGGSSSNSVSNGNKPVAKEGNVAKNINQNKDLVREIQKEKENIVKEIKNAEPKIEEEKVKLPLMINKHVKTEVKSGNYELESGKKVVISDDDTTAIRGMKDTLDENGNDQIINSGEIELTGKNTIGIEAVNGYTGINKGVIKSTGKNAIAMSAENGSLINENKIEMSADTTNLVGMMAGINTDKREFSMKNKGDITITLTENEKQIPGDTNIVQGMLMFVKEDEMNPKLAKGKMENRGNIKITAGKNSKAVGMEGRYVDIKNLGSIDVSGARDSIGIEAINSKAVNTNGGRIKVSAGGTGMLAEYDESSAINHGQIIVNEVNNLENRRDSFGMNGINVVENSTVKLINETDGRIDVYGKWIYGMNGHLGTAEVPNGESGFVEIENKGTIFLRGTAGTGIKGEIDVFRNNSGKELVNAINRGTIHLEAENGSGMEGKISYHEETDKNIGTRNINLVNEGIINVKGFASYGMVADGKGVVAINKGTINLGEEALGAMLALNEGKVINDKEGKIYIDSNNDMDGKSKEEFALQSLDNGIVENRGTIEVARDLKLDGNYVMAINKDGSNGEIKAENVEIMKGAVLSVKLAPEAMANKKEIEKKIVEAKENLNVGENVEVKTDSVLYTANLIQEEKELSVKVEKENSEDFANDKFKEIAKILDNSEDLIDEMFEAKDSKELNEIMASLAGKEYLNLPRQIFDINENFNKWDSSLLSTLYIYDYNFRFVTNDSKVKSKNFVNGYKNDVVGFDGGLRLNENTFAVLGYSDSIIKYNESSSKENIKSIHTGIYKDMKKENVNIRISLAGEYNFHEMDRDVLEKKASSKFNSYVVGGKVEASRKFGDSLYVEPLASLGVNYGNREKIEENGAGDKYNLRLKQENYVSIKPEVGAKVGKDFENVQLFAIAKYSYELGNLDKDMKVEFLKNEAKVKNNKMEKGNLNIAVGTNVNFKGFDLSVEIGEDFRESNNTYVKTGISYSF